MRPMQCGACSVGFYRGAKRCGVCEGMVQKGIAMGATASVLALMALVYLVAGSVNLHSSRFPRVHALASRLAAGQVFHQLGTLCKILLGWYQAIR